MSRNSTRNYHESRADEECRLAEEATDPTVAQIHRELAAMHRRRMTSLVEEREPLPGTRPRRPGAIEA